MPRFLARIKENRSRFLCVSVVFRRPDRIPVFPVGFSSHPSCSENECPWPFTCPPGPSPGPSEARTPLQCGTALPAAPSSTACSVPNTFPAALHGPMHSSPRAGEDHPHFTGGETETQRCSVTCPKSTIRPPGPESVFSAAALHSLP